MDEEDLFCANCGTENPYGGCDEDAELVSKTGLSQQASVHAFGCENCGASMSYDASAQSLRCPFCGSLSMTARPNARTLKPEGIVPFEVERQEIESTLKKWLSQGFWRPSDTVQASVLSEVTPVYVPFWIFSATTKTNWCADTSPPPVAARGSWYPMSGSQANRYSGVLIAASGILSQSEIQGVGKFNLQAAKPPDAIDLTNIIVEEFRLPRKDARPLARAAFERLEMAASQQYVPNRVRNLQVNVTLGDMRSEPMLLPVWITVYHYNKQPYRVLINGQTGECYGNAPISYTKISLAFAALFLIILFIIAIVVASSGMR